MSSKVEYVVSLGDMHIPDENKQAIETVFKFLRFIKPSKIILHELLDCKAISKFNKGIIDKIGLQCEFNTAIKYISRLRLQHPKAEMILLDSNHQDRIEKFINDKAPELSVLSCLGIRKLLELDKWNVKSCQDYTYKNVLYLHGRLVRKDAGASAKASVDNEGMSIVMGHTHRGGVYYVKKRGSSFVGVEGGCLCDLNPGYIKGTANWINGFSLVEYRGNKYYAQFIPIFGNSIVYGNKIFSGGK